MKKIIATIALSIAIAATLTPISTDADIVPLKPTEYELKQYSVTALLEYYAQEYNTPIKPLLKVGWCESQYNEKAHNKTDPNGGSKNYMQFQNKTFYAYAKILDIEKPDIWDKVQIAQVSAYMFSIGEGKQWTTYRAYMNGGSYSFFYKPQNKIITVYCK